MRARTVLLLAAPAVAAALALTGCTGESPAPATPTPTTPETIAPGTDVLPTTPPELRPGGTAAENKLYWDATIERYWAQFGLGSTQTMVDHLVGAGYDPAALEITADSTAIGLGVDSIEVSARFGGECLISDVRAERWSSVILPVLGSGQCLVGWQHQI